MKIVNRFGIAGSSLSSTARPDRRLIDCWLQRLPINWPSDGRIEVASVYLENTGGKLEEFHVVYQPGQEDAATNAIGQWYGKPWFGLTNDGAKALAQQVRLKEIGRQAKAANEAAAKAAAERDKAAKEAEERRARRRAKGSDSIFRKWKENEQE